MAASSESLVPPTTQAKPTWGPQPSGQPTFWLRPTLRIRLTLLYGGMFLTAGIVLLAIIYTLAANALDDGVPSFGVSGSDIKVISDRCPPLSSAVSLHETNAALNGCFEQQRAAALNTLLNRSVLALLGLTVVAFAFGYAMAGRVLSPLGRITRTAQRVAGSDLHRRIELGGPDDELKELADT
ncbi:HAMP domain-containing protein, partial [Streptomyces sp. NPDC048650]|uniref:HAMP domain-containing protein n=1 Tax=unclassified Streptomyces TaxID=2593676 RepID=UPI003712E648